MAPGLEFSARSFREIADLEVRAGRRDPGSLFPQVLATIQELKQLRMDRREALKAVPDDRPVLFASLVARYDQRADQLRTQKLNLLLGSLNEVSLDVTNQIVANEFSWGLTVGKEVAGKPTYRIASSLPNVFFAAKQLEYSIRRSYFGMSVSRNRLISQLVGALDNRMPRMVLKTDIKSFFENVPHDRIRDMWNPVQAIGTLSTSFLERFLEECADLTGSETGLPRGIGMSSQLAEALLQPVDQDVRSIPSVTYFARYVDDMVIVISSEDESELRSIRVSLETRLRDLGLELNTAKTESLLSDGAGGVRGAFNFLGYRFENAGGNVKVGFPSSKMARYRFRIDAALSAWQKHPSTSTGHQGLLLDRWRFMTGNTRLANNKRNAMTGVYFSNPHLTDLSTLRGLDSYAQSRLQATSIPDPLKSRLAALSFETGFRQRTMHHFTQTQLVRITAAWKK